MPLLFSGPPVDPKATAEARHGNMKPSMVLLTMFLCAAFSPAPSQAQHTICDDGFGAFTSDFQTGVTVSVSAAKSRGFANRACNAALRWGTNTVYAARGASQIDIDVIGADLGLGTPVVAFQVKKSALTRLMTYEIYSLKKPPELLKTITGGDSYDAQDYSLDGRVAIWTDDAAAVDGFENLPLSSIDFPPTVVLRFEKGRLIDVGSEYQSYYDQQISEVKAGLSADALGEFKKSDGKLSNSVVDLENLHHLLRTKIKVLEIVWAYLYCGREQQAWDNLAQMWPAADLSRIRSAIEDARARGILRQVDEVEKPGPHPRKRRHAMVYDMTTQVRGGREEDAFGDANAFIKNVKPIPIYLGIQFPKGEIPAISQSRLYLDLVIDEAGKVRSAKLANQSDAGPVGDTLIHASANWNFIPGFRDGRIVASRIELGVSPYQ
jgi:hypothetical protein